jgi:hypothetical protein
VLPLVTELVRPKSDSVPARFRVCGQPGALSLIVKAPLSVPGEVGVKVTLTMQPEPDGITDCQLLSARRLPYSDATDLQRNGACIRKRDTLSYASANPLAQVQKTSVMKTEKQRRQHRLRSD